MAYCQSFQLTESNRKTLSSTKEVDNVVHGVGVKSKWGTDDRKKQLKSKSMKKE